jgi:hypothetical protein
VDKIAAHIDSCAVGVLLLWVIILIDMHVHDVTFVVVCDVIALNENNSIDAFADSGDALSKTFKFLHVGFAPQFLVLGDQQ